MRKIILLGMVMSTIGFAGNQLVARAYDNNLATARYKAQENANKICGIKGYYGNTAVMNCVSGRQNGASNMCEMRFTCKKQ